MSKPPPSLLNQLPKITNQQAEMFSNILQKSATSSSSSANNSFLTSKTKRDEQDERISENKRVKRSKSESSTSSSSNAKKENLDKILRDKNSFPPVKDKHLSSSSSAICFDPDKKIIFV